MMGRMGKWISGNKKKTVFLVFVSMIVGYCTVPIPVPLFLPDWVTDTRIPVSQVVWLDSRRIVVWRGESRRNPGEPGGKAEYVLWTNGPDGGSVTPVDDINTLVGPDFCDGSGVVWNVQTKRREWSEVTKDGMVNNDFVCAETPIPDSAKGLSVFALRPGHGVISRPLRDREADYDSEEWKSPYRWHADDGSGRVVTLPMGYGNLDFSTEDIKYAPFLDAYLANHGFHEKGTDCDLAWWIYPGPKFEKFCATARGSGFTLFPTRLGVASSSRSVNILVGDIFENGIYLGVEGRTVRLLNGYGYGLKVSPDGCRMAISHSRRIQAPPDGTPFYLYIIDLCGHEAEIRELPGAAFDGI